VSRLKGTSIVAAGTLRREIRKLAVTKDAFLDRWTRHFNKEARIAKETVQRLAELA